jgi:hypothetical protein
MSLIFMGWLLGVISHAAAVWYDRKRSKRNGINYMSADWHDGYETGLAEAEWELRRRNKEKQE